jgi:hypothetical protein
MQEIKDYLRSPQRTSVVLLSSSGLSFLWLLDLNSIIINEQQLANNEPPKASWTPAVRKPRAVMFIISDFKSLTTEKTWTARY